MKVICLGVLLIKGPPFILGFGQGALLFNIPGILVLLQVVGARSVGCLMDAFRVYVSGLGFRVSGLGFRLSGLGFRVSGLGFPVGLGFRVQPSKLAFSHSI